MDYIGNKCPVCEKYFHAHDDVVVCPECGTPHHRDCYNGLGRCANFDKHKDGFDYQEDLKEYEDENDGLITCKKCGTKNSESAFFCSKCQTPLHEQTTNNGQATQTGTQSQPPFGTSPFGSSPQSNNPNVILFDPLAGVSPNTDLGDGITAGETAKFVKQNTPYFITVFNNIKNFSKSRYNFCAMLFGGGYLLYRKMYKIGTVITVLQTAMTILYFYLNYFIVSNNTYDKFLNASAESDYNASMMYFSQLPHKELLMLLLFFLLAFIIFIMNIVIGGCANRIYYNHCRKEIMKIKVENDDPKKYSETLTKKGGVNIALGLSLWISYTILSYLPSFFY